MADALYILQREVIYLWFYSSVVFHQIIWYWVFGILTGSLISVFVKDKIYKMFSSMQSGLRVFGIVPAALLGAASPICMYGTVPIASSLNEKGMREDWLAAFMMSSVLLNPQLIFYSAALGSAALIIRIVFCLLCGIVAGLCVHFFYSRKGHKFFRFSKLNKSVQKNRDTTESVLMLLIKSILRNIKITGPYLIIGILITAAFQRYIPDDFIVGLFGINSAFGILMAASMGVPVYACGGGTIPLLQYWLTGGMSLGAATAFMITGPATKITNLGAMKIILGTKNFIIYILFCIIFAILSGFIVNLIII